MSEPALPFYKPRTMSFRRLIKLNYNKEMPASSRMKQKKSRILYNNREVYFRLELLIIDELGRLQLPQKFLNELGIERTTELIAEIREGKLIIQLPPQQAQVCEKGHVLVVKSEPLGNLETIIDDLREERVNELTKW